MCLPGCAKEDEKISAKNEIEINLVEVRENTAVINCVYNPDKSEMYQLSLGGVPYLNNRTKSGTMHIENLQSGMDYKVVAISYDVNCNPVDSSEVNFKAAGVIEDRVPDGNMLSMGTSIWDEEEYNNCPIKVSVKKMTDEIAIGFDRPLYVICILPRARWMSNRRICLIRFFFMFPIKHY